MGTCHYTDYVFMSPSGLIYIMSEYVLWDGAGLKNWLGSTHHK